MNMKNKVLIIAAHPDDDILGCGGFMSRYRGYMKLKFYLLLRAVHVDLMSQIVIKLEKKF